jgi:hypothetical protein
MNARNNLFVAIIALFASSSAAHASWPEFRGPEGDGSATGNVPLHWSETENVAWKTPIHDRGWSSPVVWDDQTWMGTATEDGTELFAVCVDLQSGKVVHDINLFGTNEPQEIHVFNSHASPTPTIEPGRVYMHFGAYGTTCLDTATGLAVQPFSRAWFVAHSVWRPAHHALRRIRLPIHYCARQTDGGDGLEARPEQRLPHRERRLQKGI